MKDTKEKGLEWKGDEHFQLCSYLGICVIAFLIHILDAIDGFFPIFILTQIGCR